MNKATFWSKIKGLFKDEVAGILSVLFIVWGLRPISWILNAFGEPPTSSLSALVSLEWAVVYAVVRLCINELFSFFAYPLVIEYEFVNKSSRHKDVTYIPKDFDIGTEVLVFRLTLGTRVKPRLRWLFRNNLPELTVSGEEWMTLTYTPRNPHAGYNLVEDGDCYRVKVGALIGQEEVSRFTYDLMIQLEDNTVYSGILNVQPQFNGGFLNTFFMKLICRVEGLNHRIEVQQE